MPVATMLSFDATASPFPQTSAYIFSIYFYVNILKGS